MGEKRHKSLSLRGNHFLTNLRKISVIVKIPFNSPKHIALFLAVSSLVLWWLFDRSKNGLGLAVLVTICFCAALQVIIYLGVFRNDEPDFLFARAWIPLYFFCGVVTFGSIGRQLAMTEYNFGGSKEHVD
ncbi:PREDICTED: insulin-induced gene 2 protein-like [Acropora digitifera]|uniref:insulin-induced gene 2 protein-like n=1 Tax=Acropora digitifera TaxID=70779 RepID=UPI00077A2BF3|nr:PREDICTED: insulin-induced gene 2 protein-like [Acropora digitifera]